MSTRQTPEGSPLPPRCPFLGAEGRTGTQDDPVEHPSFENRCWAGDRPTSLLLTDQATLCLCTGFRHCPRFVAARAAHHAAVQSQRIPVQSGPGEAPVDAAIDDPLSHELRELQAEYDAVEKAQSNSRKRWGWIGAGLIFMSSLLCGGLFAAYVGWQMVRTDLLAGEPGRVDTIAAPPAIAQPQVYLIVTATSEPADLGAAGDIATGPTPVYPAAVTPTPGGVATTNLGLDDSPSGAADAGQVVQDNSSTAPQTVPQQQAVVPEVQAQPQAQAPLATSPVDVQLQIPTRRPTPVLDIPTSTPVAGEATATWTPTPLPPLGTPFVLFSARDETLEPGECTLVTWHVENVRAVYYENLGVDGQGEHEECVRGDPGSYNLLVVLADGSTRTYTATVDLVIPTDTPKPTPTFTIPPEPTATWTPSVPTNTPIPPISWGVRLEASDGSELTCSRGATCEVDLYVTNTSIAVDSINIAFTEAGAWPHRLCRMDGVCSDSSMTLVNMSPSNTGVIRLQVEVPSNPDFGEMVYRFRATSESSGGSVASEQVSIRVTAQ